MPKLADRLRCIAEDQLFSEGFYTQAETVHNAAEINEDLLGALKTLLDASGRSQLDKMNVVRLQYAQCAARDAIAKAEGR